ncbi:MAG: hypothetical protein NTY08_14900 [Proteobacteria bacterium]|jgi:hypothetical protein|nr:hypothetical protein [Pseudomonadota bacterium]
MAQTTFVEQVIEVASRLKECLAGLQEAYQQMPSVIEREHQAIARREFGLVTTACELKETIGGRIEVHFGSMTLAGERLAKLVQIQWPGRERPTTLTQYRDAISDLAQAQDSEVFASQVLTHVASGFAKQVTDFLALYIEIKPQIEANKYLVTHMMSNYQESYRFWQEVSEQVAVSYNSNGVQKAAGRNSGFRAKA